ncbi:hypothetical protein MNEG_9040, partial [Monoraphidium neglectum]
MQAPLQAPRPQRRVSFGPAHMLPGAAGSPLLGGSASSLAAGFAGLFDGPLPPAPMQQASQSVLGGGPGSLFGGLTTGPLGQLSSQQQQQQAQQQQQPVSSSLRGLRLDDELHEALGPLPMYPSLGSGDGWGAPASAAGAGAGAPPPHGLLLSLSQQLQQQQAPGPPGIGAGGYLQQQLGPQQGGPVAPRAPRARRHSMFVPAGHDPHAARRSSVGNYDNAALLHQHQHHAAAGTASPAGSGAGCFGPAGMPGGRGTPNGYHSSGGPAAPPPAVTERLAALGIGTGAGPPISLAQQQPLQPQPGLQQQQPWAGGAAGAAPPGAFAPAAPRAPAAGGSRRHSWCPSTLYYHPDGPRAALQTRLAYRALQQQQAGAAAALLGAGGLDALAALQQPDSGGGGGFGGGSAPVSSALLGSQPGSPGAGGGAKALPSGLAP